MKISDALKTESDLRIPFGDQVLNVTYRPSAVTIQDVEALKSDRDIRRVAEQIRQQVVRWDLTDDYSNIIPLERPAPHIVTEDGRPVEQTLSVPADQALADPLASVPISILTTVLIEIQTAQRPSPQA